MIPVALFLMLKAFISEGGRRTCYTENSIKRTRYWHNEFYDFDGLNRVGLSIIELLDFRIDFNHVG
jgi:hypothetical protein